MNSKTTRMWRRTDRKQKHKRYVTCLLTSPVPCASKARMSTAAGITEAGYPITQCCHKNMSNLGDGAVVNSRRACVLRNLESGLDMLNAQVAGLKLLPWNQRRAVHTPSSPGLQDKQVWRMYRSIRIQLGQAAKQHCCSDCICTSHTQAHRLHKTCHNELERKTHGCQTGPDCCELSRGQQVQAMDQPRGCF